MWLSFGIVAILDVLNDLHVLFPAVLYLHLKLTNISQYFTEKPWSLMGDNTSIVLSVHDRN